jgi:hypothetical protein
MIQTGTGLTDTPVGSVRNVYLVVTDLKAARRRLLERGIELDLARGDYASFANFSDPDEPYLYLCGRRLLQLPKRVCAHSVICFRNGATNSRTSVANTSGSSHAAKWPHLFSVQRSDEVRYRVEKLG